MRPRDKGIGSGFVRVTASRNAESDTGVDGLFKNLSNLFDFTRRSRNYTSTMKKKTKENSARSKPSENAGVELLREFYINLKKAVSDTGISAGALAIKFGLPKQFISNILRGDHDPRFSTAVRIAKSMNLSVDGLLGNESQREAAPPQPVPFAQTVPVPSEVEVKNIHVSLAGKIAQMHENDVELLEAIASILIERKSRAMARFLCAVQDAERENPASKAKTGKSGGKGALPGGGDSGKPDDGRKDRFGNACGDGDADFGEYEDFNDDDDFDFDDDDFELDDDDDDDEFFDD
jgi:transcriptional regulator with XRE-family HTH domain